MREGATQTGRRERESEVFVPDAFCKKGEFSRMERRMGKTLSIDSNGVDMAEIGGVCRVCGNRVWSKVVGGGKGGAMLGDVNSQRWRCVDARATREQRRRH